MWAGLKSCVLLACGPAACGWDLCRDDGAFVNGWTRSSKALPLGLSRRPFTLAAVLKGRMTRTVFQNSVAPEPLRSPVCSCDHPRGLGLFGARV